MNELGQEKSQSRKKVLFVITKSNFGGAQRYVYDLATNLPSQFEPVVAFGSSGKTKDVGKLAEMLTEVHIRTIFVPELVRDVDAGGDLQALRALVRLFKLEQPDIVHLNSSKAGGIGSLAGRIARIPKIVFTAHGWPFWEDRNPLAKTIIYILSYFTVLFSHQTICISEYDKQSIQWMPFVKNKISVIYNGIPEIDFFSREESQAKLFSPEMIENHAQDLWLLTNAELHPNKNLLFAIDAVKLHNEKNNKKIFYSIIGDGEMKEAVESYVTKHHLNDQIQLLGFVSDARRYMKGFDAFFLSSKKEGLPYVLIEAGLAGLPILASNVGGIPEIITDGKTGILIHPKDLQKTAQALTKLTNDPILQTLLGSQLQKEIVSKFGLKTMLDQTISRYLT